MSKTTARGKSARDARKVPPATGQLRRTKTPVVYGIPNCDTVKKARSWLDEHGIDYTFHDYKKQGVPVEKLAAWCDMYGWERVLNRAGTTFRKLPETERSSIDLVKAIALMAAQPSMIKRPIVESGDTLLVGFDEDQWSDVYA